jgi:hypothetical protein
VPGEGLTHGPRAVGSADQPAFPAQRFTVYVRSLGDRAFLPPSPRIGTALLGLDEVTDSQIGWCRSYAEEIMTLDVGIMDVIWMNSKGDRRHAEQLAARKDDKLTPILSRMDRLLEATKNDVIHGTFDLDRFMRKSQALEAETSRLASTLR